MLNDNAMSKKLQNAVANMRKWQKEYFKTRSPQALSNSKRWEREVDKILAAMEDPGLFGVEAVQPEWRKSPISFMGGAIIKTSIGPMYSDHVVAGQLYLKFEELHLLPGYDEN